MYILTYILLIAAGNGCLAYYKGDYEVNLIEREEPQHNEGLTVECPVCNTEGNWIPHHEDCSIEKNNKKYKLCKFGTYMNEVCGRPDCFRGPGEKCSEKMEIDFFGARCAFGYYCNKVAGICVGMTYALDSNLQYFLNLDNRYPRPSNHLT